MALITATKANKFRRAYQFLSPFNKAGTRMPVHDNINTGFLVIMHSDFTDCDIFPLDHCTERNGKINWRKGLHVGQKDITLLVLH